MNTGDILNNKYLIRARLDEGGITETYLAMDQIDFKEVVVKMLYLSKAKDWKYIELFERESSVLKGIKHKNIPKFIDTFTIDYAKDKIYVTVQEYIRGQNIFQLINSGKRLSENDIIAITIQILEVLLYFQEHKPPIIHRDINPKNIIIAENNKAFLVDLGSVQNYVITDTLSASTVVGTFGYMSPEQAIGRATPSSDLYSLGMTIIFMMTGKHPGLIEQVNLKPDYKNSAIISKRLNILIDILIEPDEKKRIKTAAEALDMLKHNKFANTQSSSIDLFTKMYQNQLIKDSKIVISNSPDGIFIGLPTRFGRNLQGTFGKTFIILNPKKIIVYRSLGKIWKKQYTININDVITCTVNRKNNNEKKPVTYITLETFRRNINFAHNLKEEDKESLKNIINDFILNNKKIEEKDEKISGIDFISSTIKKVKKFINSVIKDNI